MAQTKSFQFLVEGGKASAGPPIGPALGPLGINVMAVVNKINEMTKEFAGMKVPVKVTVDVERKSFTVEVGTPTTTALIVKELKLEKGAHSPGKELVGDLPLESVVKIAIVKKKDLRSKTLKAAIKQVLGTCLSMGVTVNGKSPKEVIKELNAGVHDDVLKKFEEEWVKA